MYLVSVIMGIYNGEKRMDSAIKSIINQTYTDWEMIICDDGSTDNSWSKLLEWQRIDDRIKVIKNDKNLGLNHTLNNCLKCAKGEFIARMDDDDWSYPDRFALQVDFLKKHKDIDFVSSSIDVYDGKKIVYTQNVRSNYPNIKDFLWGSPFVHPAVMFKKESILKVNGYRCAKETRRAEDFDLFMRMYANNMKGYNFSQPLLRYFVNVESMGKRKFRYRVDEVIVRYKGYKMMKLIPKGLVFILKPILVGLIPRKTLLNIQKQSYGKGKDN